MHHLTNQGLQVIQGCFRGHPPLAPLATVQRRTQEAQTPRVAPHLAKALGIAPSPGAAGQPHAQQAARNAARPPVQPSGNSQAFAVPASLNLRPSGGQTLPAPVREKMESFFRSDFSDVRIHVGHEASAIGALAFTHGSNIFFSPGLYNPETPQGQQLLGHELTHVVQQRAGRVRNPLASGVAVVQDIGLEAEADRMGLRVASLPNPLQTKMAAGRGPNTPLSPGLLQRKGAALRLRQQSTRQGQQLSVLHEGRQIGKVDVLPSGRDMAKVYNLEVDAAYRGQGAGDILLRAAGRAGASMGKARIGLESQDNGSGRLTRWYRSEGFHQVGVSDRGMAILETTAQALMSRGNVPPAERR